jgi:hypothetical protein
MCNQSHIAIAEGIQHAKLRACDVIVTARHVLVHHLTGMDHPGGPFQSPTEHFKMSEEKLTGTAVPASFHNELMGASCLNLTWWTSLAGACIAHNLQNASESPPPPPPHKGGAGNGGTAAVLR